MNSQPRLPATQATASLSSIKGVSIDLASINRGLAVGSEHFKD